MARRIWGISLLLVLFTFQGIAQTDGHYTMFMFNKLYYNPAYAGEKELPSFNATYRDQWSDMPGAPKGFNFSADAPIGKFTRQFRPVALGITINNDQMGVEKYTTVMANYAYRLMVKNAMLSLGLKGGAKSYSANYNQLDLAHSNDPNFQSNNPSLLLPNFGIGAFWSAKDKHNSDKYFIGFSIPTLLQNHYGKNTQNNTVLAKESRLMYLTGGYILRLDKTSSFTLTPQMILRSIGNFNYSLPVNCDFNLTAVYKNRVMLGITYRTDKSMEFIFHMQVLRELNIGYAYDYSFSPVSVYLGQTHEINVGFDLIRKSPKYINPRFVRSF